MASLTSCLAKAGDLLPADLKAAIVARASELRAAGMTGAGASRQAVADVLAATQMKRAEVDAADKDGRTLYAEKADEGQTDRPDDEVARSGDRLDQMAQDYPQMRVILPGKTEPQLLSEALEGARAEAADEAGFADLVKVAAECALNFG